jgi:hypothetical protein
VTCRSVGVVVCCLTHLETAVRPSLLAFKVAAATALGTVVLGGVAAAATGSLPGPLNLADDSSPSGLPSGSTDPSTSTSPTDTTSPSESADPTSSAAPTGSWSPTKGPDALGPAAWGLCHGFGNKTWGNGASSTASPNPAGRKPGNPSVAYANLVAASGSLGLTVDQYCTLVLAGQSPTATGLPTAGPTGSPAATSKHGRGGLHGHGHGHGHGGQGNNHP